MSEQNEKIRKAEQRITAELGNEANAEPGSIQEDEAKERRATAEKDMAGARDERASGTK